MVIGKLRKNYSLSVAIEQAVNLNRQYIERPRIFTIAGMRGKISGSKLVNLANCFYLNTVVFKVACKGEFNNELFAAGCHTLSIARKKQALIKPANSPLK